MNDNYREVPDDKVIEAPETPGFGEWRHLYAKAARKHPAKMTQTLVRALLARYTKEGDMVLDPMAGAMSTVVQAALMGRHGVGVEYEAWMVEAAKETVRVLEREARQTITPTGSAIVFRGDARDLTGTLRQKADAVLTSPPYEGTAFETAGKDEEFWEEMARRTERPAWRDPDSQTRRTRKDVDAVVTSPPYGRDAESHGELHEKGRGEPLPRHYADTVVTSPPYNGPYAEGHSKARGGQAHLDNRGATRDYGADPDNEAKDVEAEVRHLERAREGAETAAGNIGRTRGETYLDAMLQVYRECFDALKPGGRIIVVVKNPVRDYRPLRLDLDTMRLLAAAGFVEEDHLYRPLRTKSFWIRNYETNTFPKAKAAGRVPADAPLPTTNFEDVLVWRKPET